MSTTQNQKPCVNNLVGPLLTDLYQLTMAYAYWKCDKHLENAAFDVLFRKNPFKGEYTIFCGVQEVLRFLSNYKFTPEEISYVKKLMPTCDPEFFHWLESINLSQVKVYSFLEGSVVFPHESLLRVEGPLAICQLLETTILTLVNYSSLIATNAARHRIAVGADKELIEFGLRRAQGPDGGVSASRYSYIGGYNGSSNVKAGQLFGIDIKGTHAHAFVSSFSSFDDLVIRKLKDVSGTKEVDLVDLVLEYRKKIGKNSTKLNELTAFIAYAIASPHNFMALVDTYNTLNSGVPNFLAVALALHELGYKPYGIRLDSGDLAYLSRETRKQFAQAAEQFKIEYFKTMKIVASSDLNEEVLYALEQQKHDIDIFGVGTSLVTCEGNPALGCVYKLTWVNEKPTMKISNNSAKVSLPCRKEIYRLLGADKKPILDLIIRVGSTIPVPGVPILCRHPFEESKRAKVIPTEVVPLLHLVWDGRVVMKDESIDAIRDRACNQVRMLREDVKRYLNPTPYKVSVDNDLYTTFHNLWLEEVPIQEIM